MAVRVRPPHAARSGDLKRAWIARVVAFGVAVTAGGAASAQNTSEPTDAYGREHPAAAAPRLHIEMRAAWGDHVRALHDYAQAVHAARTAGRHAAETAAPPAPLGSRTCSRRSTAPTSARGPHVAAGKRGIADAVPGARRPRLVPARAAGRAGAGAGWRVREHPPFPTRSHHRLTPLISGTKLRSVTAGTRIKADARTRPHAQYREQRAGSRVVHVEVKPASSWFYRSGCLMPPLGGCQDSLYFEVVLGHAKGLNLKI